MTASVENGTRGAISPHRRRGVRCCGFLLLVFLACANVFAQQNAVGQDKNSAKAAADSVKKVDESEDNFRKRMELRDERYRQHPRADLTYISRTGKEKIDQLPPASREHIREQLRDMIIASRQWKPGEDVSDYPYEPSVAAQKDAKLLQQEREAWAEQLQKYQQREAAAYADAQNQAAQAGGAKGAQQKGNGSKGSGRAGTKGAAGANSTASAQDRSKSARGLEPYEDQESAEEAMSTAGVSEDALSFLRSKGAQAGASSPQEKGSAEPQGKAALAAATGQQTARSKAQSNSGSAKTQAPPGTLTRSQLAMLQGMNAATDAASGQDSRNSSAGSSTAAASEQQASPDQSPGATSAAEERTETQAGTLPIEDLKNLGTSTAPGASTSEAMQPDSPKTAEQPGTLKIAELKNLGGN